MTIHKDVYVENVVPYERTFSHTASGVFATLWPKKVKIRNLSVETYELHALLELAFYELGSSRRGQLWS
jgi:hypothetical protein